MSNNFKDDEQAAIADFVASFKELTATMKTAAEVRYEAPPRSAAAKGIGKDPTGDTVIDDARETLESTLRTSAAVIGVAARQMYAANRNLRDALSPYCD